MTPFEINALAAEKVMGWELQRWPNGKYKRGWRLLSGEHAPYDCKLGWSPWTRIEDAMKLAEKLRPMCLESDDPDGLWVCRFALPEGPDEDWHTAVGRAETAPAAITLAALRVRGVEVTL